MSNKSLSAVLLPVGSGKSHLVTELSRYRHEKRRVRVIDLDLYAEKNTPEIKSDLPKEDTIGNSWELNVFPAIKAKLLKDIENFAKDEFLIVTSNPSLLDHLKVSPDRTITLTPSTKLFVDLLEKKGPKEIAQLVTSRESFNDLKQKVYKFSSWAELAAIAARTFGLKLA